MDDPDRLTASPLPALVCPNCGGYMLPPRCGGCGWVMPDDDDEAEEPTDLYIETEAATVGAPIIPPIPTMNRSGRWPAFVAAFLAKHPKCEGCGRKATTGHHVKPVSRFPDLELVESNLAAVCLPCHFVLCHGGDWSLYLSRARECLAAHAVEVSRAT